MSQEYSSSFDIAMGISRGVGSKNRHCRYAEYMNIKQPVQCMIFFLDKMKYFKVPFVHVINKRICEL